MKAKLIKDEDGYSLFTREENSTNRKFIATTQGTYVEYKLSKQNCDDIFGVVDVEKLAEDFAKNHSIYPTAQDDTEYGFKSGFNKAMELNKDKVFTLEDMKRAFKVGFSNGFASDIISKHKLPEEKEKLFNEFIQPLQQPTEIEVEIEMETKKQLVNGYRNQPDNVIGFVADYENILQPKLDSQGCLIIKKI